MYFFQNFLWKKMQRKHPLRQPSTPCTGWRGRSRAHSLCQQHSAHPVLPAPHRQSIHCAARSQPHRAALLFTSIPVSPVCALRIIRLLGHVNEHWFFFSCTWHSKLISIWQLASSKLRDLFLTGSISGMGCSTPS